MLIKDDSGVKNPKRGKKKFYNGQDQGDKKNTNYGDKFLLYLIVIGYT